MSKNVIIVDVDGTIAINKNRNPYDWRNAHQDTPNLPIIQIVRQLSEASRIIYVSGRKEESRSITSDWIDKYVGCVGDLYLRANGDNRPDWVVKKEIYENHIQGRFSVWCVFDDRNQTVEMWRELGLTCLQVAPGCF